MDTAVTMFKTIGVIVLGYILYTLINVFKSNYFDKLTNKNIQLFYEFIWNLLILIKSCQ